MPSLIIHECEWNNRITIENNRKLKTVKADEIMEILTYFFLQIFIIFDGLSNSSKKSYGNPEAQLPFKEVVHIYSV